MTWPTATLDNGARARIIAAAVPSAAMDEVIIDAPYDQVWPWLSDLEHSVATFDPTVGRIRVLSRDGERWRVRSSMPLVPVGIPFDVRMEDGFCLMRAKWRFYMVVMAATPVDANRTRITHVEGIPLPFTRWLRPLLRWFVRIDTKGMARRFERGRD